MSLVRIVVSSSEEGRSRTWLIEGPKGPTDADLRQQLALPSAPDAPRDPVRHGYGVGLPVARPPERSSLLARVLVESGPDAGACLWLPHGRWTTIGRDPLCDLRVDDPGLSRHHLRVRHGRRGFEVEDLGSTNGVQVLSPAPGAGPPPRTRLRAGGTVLRLEDAACPSAAGTELDGRFHLRPWPRTVPDLPTVALTTPPRPALRTVRPPTAWSWALPLVTAAVAATLLRMPLLLVFGLLGPAMVLGQHLGDRRSARAEHREALRSWRTGCALIETELREAAEDERELRWMLDPGIASAARALLPAPTTTLWDRGAETPVVVVGEGDLTSRVTLDGTAVELTDAPITLALDEPVAVIGRPELRDAAVRSWVLQLAVAHPPSSLAITVDPDAPPADWDLLGWLPHTRPHDRAEAPRTVAWGSDLLLVEDTRDAPPGMTRVRLVDLSVASIERPGCPPRSFRPTLLGLPLARALARRLAGLQEGPRRPRGQRGVVPMLGDLVPWPADRAAAVSGWAAPGVRLEVPVGTGDNGRPLLLDLARDGPHALVAGTTGSGKSELLRSLVTGLALLNPPSRVNLLLIDYKGGSTLGACARLPHSTGLVTDLDPHLAERVLVSLRAELTRREQVLARAGVRDVRDYEGAELPRLVVVIDEFRVLAEELPDFLSGMVRVAAVGRSLGLHVVLATQRPAGIVTPDLRANVNLRVALRVRDAADSQDVLETAEAAMLPEGDPGLALLRTGASPSRRFRVALVGPSTASAASSTSSGEWTVKEVAGVWEGWRCLHDDDSPGAARSGLSDLPEILSRAASVLDDRATRAWLPPLPPTVRLQDVPAHTETPSRPWGLADRPDRQRREPLVWRGENHLAIVGAARTGRSTALAALAASACPSWLYILDPGGGLDGVLPRADVAVRAWVGPDERAHGLRVLEVLNELVDRRRAGSDPRGRSAPVVFLLDGWDRWQEAYAELESGRGVDMVLRLLREGPAAGVTGAVSGDRSLLLGRAAGHFPELWALRLNDPTDLALAGLPLTARPREQPPGRVVRTRDGVVAQVVLPGPLGPTTGAETPGGPEPPRVLALPRKISSETAWAVGGDEAREVPPPTGSVLVLGPARSGVSTTLRRLSGPGCDHRGDGRSGTVLVNPGAWDDGALARRLHADVRTVVVDDAHLLAGTLVEDVVLEWATRTSGRLLVGGDVDGCANLYRGLVPHVARERTGVVLQPSSAQHGAVLGVRPALGDPPVPGRGVLVERGRCTRIQVVTGP